MRGEDESRWSANGSSSNLFLEGDPEAVVARAPVTRAADGPTRTRRIVPVAASSPGHAAAPSRPNPASFTRPRALTGAAARGYLDRADANSRRIATQLAARRYAALAAVVLVAAMLLGLSWLGLSLRDAATTRDNAIRRANTDAALVKHDRARIAALAGQARTAQAPAAVPATRHAHVSSAATQPRKTRPATTYPKRKGPRR
jgi:hypothetical protein